MPRSLRPLRRPGARTPDGLDRCALDEPIPDEAMEHATIEELTCFPARPVAGGVGIRTLVAAAAGVLVLAVGLGGRLASPGPAGATLSAPTAAPASPSLAASPAPSLDLAEPRPGAVAWGGTVRVEGVAGRALGPVHIAVLVGSAVLGAADLDVDRPGPISASIPVLAPPYPLAARVVVTAAAPAGPSGTGAAAAGVDVGGAVLAERAISVRAQGPVVVWSAAVRVADGRRALELVGFAPATLDEVRVELRGTDGHALARGSVTARGGRGATGSAGRILGLARVDVHLPVPDDAIAPFTAVLTWRDATDGTAGTAFIPVMVEARREPRGR